MGSQQRESSIDPRPSAKLDLPFLARLLRSTKKSCLLQYITVRHQIQITDPVTRILIAATGRSTI